MKPGSRWNFEVDIVGRCNLSCPSCPVGNSPTIKQPSGFMKPEMLDRIVQKALRECNGPVNFSLYNWTEPFLHPHIDEMIRVVRSHGAPVGISSNLNLLRNIDAVMEANPTYLKVSVSGFDQERYSITHRQGDIEKVKTNMRLVAEAKERAGATTRLEIPFHRYLGNHDQEAKMAAYGESLGFKMTPVWAYLMPFEKALAFADPDAIDVQLTEDDHATLGRLALPMHKALEVARSKSEPNCRLRDRQVAINSEGHVTLCCTTYDPVKYGIGPFLEMSLDEIQGQRNSHDACNSCMKNGIHNLFMYEAEEEFDGLALANVAEHFPEANLPGMAELRKQNRPSGIRALPRKIRKKWNRWQATRPAR